MKEEIHYLLGKENLKIIQSPDCFSFSLDSMLLPNFVTVNLRAKKILDIGCGNAPIPLILSERSKAQITGVEIQKDAYDMARRSVTLNQKEKQIHIVHDDIHHYATLFDHEEYDIITCNPPYFPYQTSSIVNVKQQKTIARHDKMLKLEDIMKISRKLLKNNGILALVQRPERFVDIVTLMRKSNIEPKRVLFIYPKKGKEANILLIEGMKNGKPGLKILDPIYVHDENCEYTSEIKKLLRMNG